MLTFVISLLFTAGAAFALLVIVGMLAANRQGIAAALAGRGAFAAAGMADGGTVPQLMEYRLRVGPVRHGRGRGSLRAANSVNALRAAA